MSLPSLITTTLKKKNKETKLVHSIRDQIYGERGGSDKGHQGERSNKQKDSKAAIQPCHRWRRGDMSLFTSLYHTASKFMLSYIQSNKKDCTLSSNKPLKL